MRNNDPTIIGGVGGSGTRLIAQILMLMGYNMGHDFNKACDNLSFTLLFRRLEILSINNFEFQSLINILKIGILGNEKFTIKQIDTIKKFGNTSRPHLTSDWLKTRANKLINTVANIKSKTKWGWKEPNSHIVLKQLHQTLPEMKYIHVIRNGIDMAYSENQNQLTFWGNHFINGGVTITPRNSLKYWCIVHKNLFEYSKNLKTNFYLLNFDEFCQKPKRGIMKLMKFLNHNLSAEDESQIQGLIKLPESIGRFKQNDLSCFDRQDIIYVEQLGFDVDK